MNTAIQTILGLRDKDLRRFGRPLAVIMVFVAIVCVSGAVIGHHIIENTLNPTIRKNTQKEIQFWERNSSPQNIQAIKRAINARQKIDEGFLDAARASILIMIGGGILALSHGILYWRAYELAMAITLGSTSPTVENNEEISQGGVGDI